MNPQPDILKVLEAVRERFMQTDADMIRRHTHEQAITQRLAVYLEAQLPGWQVNCEYNRQGEDDDPKKDSIGAKRRPDIVVHERGHDRSNLLVIEVKPAWEDPEKIEKDRDKLRRMLPPPRSYRHAFLILYSDTPSPSLSFEEVKK
jgi:hypothetical protein